MSHNITQVVERAAHAYLVANRPTWLPELQIYRGIENREAQDMEGEESSIRRLPCAVLICELASALGPNWKGLWDAKLTVELHDSRALVTHDDHDERAWELFGQFSTTSIAHDLAASIENFNLSAMFPDEQGYRVEGGCWVSYLTFTLKHALCSR